MVTFSIFWENADKVEKDGGNDEKTKNGEGK